MAPLTTDTDRFLTPPKVAKRWGVNTRKVYAAIEAGELRAFDLSTRKGEGKPRWKVDPADLAEFLAKRSNTTPTPKPTRAKPRRAGRSYIH